MAGMEFELTGLENLERDLEKAVRKCPIQAKETLRRLGREFKASAKKRAEAELNPHQRKSGQENKAIRKKWGSKVVDDALGMAVLIWNSAPHFHLIENGHNLVRGGRTVGFVDGRHIMEKTKNEYENIVPARFPEMVENILK